MDNAGLIVREKEPLNLESPAWALESFLTRTDLFYIRSHFEMPRLDAESHRLRIEGAVAAPLTINYQELRAMPAHTCPVTLECAGNGRAFLTPRKSGVQWELGAVGTAEWTGVRLADVLRRARIDDRAVVVVLEGADYGKPTNDPKPDGEIRYARSLPIDMALDPDVLLAYQMNGRDLAPEHGFPVRAIVPGYYGMASVKWLSHIRVTHDHSPGYWETTEYAYWDRSGGGVTLQPLSLMKVKSVITRPRADEIIPMNTFYSVTVAAWSGAGDVIKVELSTDGGETWGITRLRDDEVQRYAWRRWEHEWRTPGRSATYTLLARATDSTGAVQPDRHDRNFGSYAVHYTVPLKVVVGTDSNEFGGTARVVNDKVENLVGESSS